MATEREMDVTPLDVTPVGSDASALPPQPIGPGKPLSIKIMSIYPGEDDHRAMLLSSSVRNPSLFNAQPRAMNYIFDDLKRGRILKSEPDRLGSDVIYYSPAVLEDALSVSIRFSYDDFDVKKYQKWLETGSKGLNLPVFMLSASLGQPQLSALMYIAGKAVNIALNAVDRLIDGENDWVSTWTLNIARAGLAPAKSGWILFHSDDGEANILVPGKEAGWSDQYWVSRDKGYVVDPTEGTLRYANKPEETVRGEPYVLAYLNGAEEPSLEGWTHAAVSAAVADRFFNTSGGIASDVGSLLEVYNDIVMARKVAEIDNRLKREGISPDEAERLKNHREAVLKHVQDASMRDIIG